MKLLSLYRCENSNQVTDFITRLSQIIHHIWLCYLLLPITLKFAMLSEFFENQQVKPKLKHKRHDFGSDARERFQGFSAEQNLDLLESTPQWHEDGTFKCCPALFYQLYTVHGVMNGHTISLVYMFMKRKTRKLYLRVLNELKEMNPCLPLYQLAIDFKIACLLAFEELISKVSIKGI